MKMLDVFNQINLKGKSLSNNYTIDSKCPNDVNVYHFNIIKYYFTIPDMLKHILNITENTEIKLYENQTTKNYQTAIKNQYDDIIGYISINDFINFYHFFKQIDWELDDIIDEIEMDGSFDEVIKTYIIGCLYRY